MTCHHLYLTCHPSCPWLSMPFSQWTSIPDMSLVVYTWHVPDYLSQICSWLSIPDMFLIIQTRHAPDYLYPTCPWLSIPDMSLIVYTWHAPGFLFMKCPWLILSIPDMPPIIQKYVFRFTISVNYSFLVQVPQTKQYFSGIESRQEISKILTGNSMNLDKTFQESR